MSHFLAILALAATLACFVCMTIDIVKSLRRPRFTERDIEILTEELNRRIEDWVDVIIDEYGHNVPTNDPSYKKICRRVELLQELCDNLDTVRL
jgi:hypothetical protein